MTKKEKILFVKNIFKKCNLRISIVFKKVKMMKNRSQFMFCVKVSQATIQKQNRDTITWCGYNDCVLSEIISIRAFNIYKESFILDKILSNITMRFIIYIFVKYIISRNLIAEMRRILLTFRFCRSIIHDSQTSIDFWSIKFISSI